MSQKLKEIAWTRWWKFDLGALQIAATFAEAGEPETAIELLEAAEGGNG